MADPSYTELTTPLTREQVLDAQLAVLASPEFALPVASYGAFDEPYATLAADAEVLADLSVKIAGIAKAGVTEDAEDDVLDVHAKDVFDEDRILGVQTKGQVTFTETAGTPHSWNAGELIFVSRLDPSIILKNTGTVTVAGLGTTGLFEIAAEETGSQANLQSADLMLATEIPGVTVTVALGTAWITQSGTDDEADEKLQLRCSLKWDTLATTGPENAYRKWALDSSSSINRVRIQEDPGAIYPAAAVTVIAASLTGGISGAVLTALSAYVETKRPLGILVEYLSASTTTFTLKGLVTVKASKRAAAEAQINLLLDTWFAGTAIMVNGEEIEGLGIGVQVRIAQVMEIVMSVAGVVSFTPKKADGTTIYVPETDDVLLGGSAVAVLARALTYVEVT